MKYEENKRLLPTKNPILKLDGDLYGKNEVLRTL